MQVKPQFKSYKILESYPILTDDYGNKIALMKFEVVTKEGYILNDELTKDDELKQFYIICQDKPVQWQNGAISFDECAYWKEPKGLLTQVFLNGLKVQEVECGTHNYNKGGVKTKFSII
jgi:hypothetical protein